MLLFVFALLAHPQDPPPNVGPPPAPVVSGAAEGEGEGEGEAAADDVGDEPVDGEPIDPTPPEPDGGGITHPDVVIPTPVPEVLPPPPPTTPWERGKVQKDNEPLGSWILTTSLIAGGGAAGGAVLAIVPLLLPFSGSSFFVIALPLIGASVAGGIALEQATGSVLIGIIGGTIVTGAVVVVAATTAIAIDGATSPWIRNITANGVGWVAGSIGGAALATGLMTWALKPHE